MDKTNEKIVVIYDNLSFEERQLFDKNKYTYIYLKAQYYLEIGPEKYRQSDYFHMPIHTLDNYETMSIADGCKQILEGIGLTQKKPFQNIGVSGFNRLFEIFHYEVIKVETTITSTGYLDKMTLKHFINDDIIQYYNLV